MDDMSHTWDDMISEILTMLVYGWSWHEIVYKKRVGPVGDRSQEEVQVHRWDDRLAQDPDPLPGDAAALDVR
jgi:hypothetical protein